MTKPDPETSNLFSEHGTGTTVLLADDISTMAQNRRLIVAGFDPSSLQTTSYDFRIGKKAIVGGQGNELDLESRPLVIEPGSYAGIISLEKVKLPNNVFAQIGSKRKFSYDGLILLTGSIIDPGYEGHLLFGLYNASTKKVVLPKGTKLCNVIFNRLPREVTPVPPDPYLLDGNFPPDFLTKIANVEVLPWNKISEEVRRIQELTQAVVWSVRHKHVGAMSVIKQWYEDLPACLHQPRRNEQFVRMISVTLGCAFFDMSGSVRHFLCLIRYWPNDGKSSADEAERTGVPKLAQSNTDALGTSLCELSLEL